MTTSAQERPTRDHATIGDALIFVAKCLFATLALVAVLIVAAIWWFNHVDDIRRKVDEQVTIADLGSKLNLCIVRSVPARRAYAAPGLRHR